MYPVPADGQPPPGTKVKRYSSYWLVQETNLYYLQSRYYNPEWGRFINADSFVSTGQGTLGNNMFAYCGNNPVARKDGSGMAYVFTDDSMAEVDPDGNFDEGGAGGGGYSYTAPKGGGGVSSRIQVGNVSVEFGHGGRHSNLTDISGLENAIAHDVVTKPPTTGYRGSADLSYSGVVYTYHYWTLSPIRISVSTYFVRGS